MEGKLNFEIARTSSGWLIIYRAFRDGSKLAINSAHRDTERAREWIKQYVRDGGHKLGTIKEI